MLGSIGVQNTTFVLILSSRYLSGDFSLVDFSPCLLVWRCPMVVFLGFKRWLLISFSLRPCHVFSKPCLITLRKIVVVGLKSSAFKNCNSSDFYVCAMILFVTDSDCWVSKGTSHIPIFLFLVTLIIYFPFLWTDISCLSNVMFFPSSHKTPNDINGSVFIFGKIWICLACFLRPGSWSVAMREGSIVIPSYILAIISFEIITGPIV